MPTLTAVIPTHNPRADYLQRTLDALRQQSLAPTDWELLLIDNASTEVLRPQLVEWHPLGRVVREDELGLTAARLRGLREARAEVLVWVDDDNVLAPEFLAHVAGRFDAAPRLGAAGGKALAVYDAPPPAWFAAGLAPMGCRDLGDQDIWMTWDDGAKRCYPDAAPIGAGMAIRRRAMQTWAEAVATDPRRKALGRTGTALTSGEDNDINLTLLEAGWQLGYFPELQLHHLIPLRRVTVDYQRRIAHACFRDYTRVLLLHGVSPWPPIPRWSLGLRKIRAWIRCRAWSGPRAQIEWCGICGQFEARAEFRAAAQS